MHLEKQDTTTNLCSEIITGQLKALRTIYKEKLQSEKMTTEELEGDDDTPYLDKIEKSCIYRIKLEDVVSIDIKIIDGESYVLKSQDMKSKYNIKSFLLSDLCSTELTVLYEQVKELQTKVDKKIFKLHKKEERDEEDEENGARNGR